MPFYLSDDDHDPRDTGPTCIWCDEPTTLSDHEPYCSEPCAIQADLDSLEDE